VFQHAEEDVQSFRMFTSQRIAGGTVKPKEIVKTFGVPMITVKRYRKLYRGQRSKGFYEAKPRHSSASVRKGPVLEQAQRLLDEVRTPRAMISDADSTADDLVRLGLAKPASAFALALDRDVRHLERLLQATYPPRKPTQKREESLFLGRGEVERA
jgi:hypothetical protein